MMNSEQGEIRRNYVVDCEIGWKVRIDADSWTLLRLKAVNVFGKDPVEMNGDRLVVYKSGEVLDGQELFLHHRYYMYLRDNEEYTYDPDFDVENMKYHAPRRLEPYPLCPATEEMVAIFRELLRDDNYLDDEAWPTDEETLMNITLIDVEEMGKKLGIKKKKVGAVGKIALKATGQITKLTQKKMREGSSL